MYPSHCLGLLVMDRTSPDSKRGYVEQAQTSVEKEQETSDVRAEHGSRVTDRSVSFSIRNSELLG